MGGQSNDDDDFHFGSENGSQKNELGFEDNFDPANGEGLGAEFGD
jgi:hypothetical protein